MLHAERGQRKQGIDSAGAFDGERSEGQRSSIDTRVKLAIAVGDAIRQLKAQLAIRHLGCRIRFEISREAGQRHTLAADAPAGGHRIHRQLTLPAQRAALCRIRAEGIRPLVLRQGAEVVELEINRGQRIAVTGATVRKIRAPALDHEAVNLQARQITARLLRFIARQISNHLGQIDPAIRCNVEQAFGFDEANLGQMPGLPGQR